MEEKLEKIMESVYKICLALVSITEHECCDYGFEEEVKSTENYVEQYEQDHKGVKE